MRDEWVLVLSPCALLDDSFASLALKRRLEHGDIVASDAPSGIVVGRVALADNAMIAAAAAAAEWRSTAMSVRVERWLSLGQVAQQDVKPVEQTGALPDKVVAPFGQQPQDRGLVFTADQTQVWAEQSDLRDVQSVGSFGLRQ